MEEVTKPEESTDASARMRELVLRAKGGEREAFGTLYSEFFDPIYRFVYFQVKQKKDAEDITQSVFMKAFQGVENYTDRGVPFSAWMYRIARNAVIDHWKKKKDSLTSDPDEVFPNIPDTQSDAATMTSENFRGEYVRSLMENLSEDQKTVVTLFFMEGLSYEEIAGVTGKSEEAIRALKHRALKVLREKVDEAYL